MSDRPRPDVPAPRRRWVAGPDAPWRWLPSRRCPSTRHLRHRAVVAVSLSAMPLLAVAALVVHSAPLAMVAVFGALLVVVLVDDGPDAVAPAACACRRCLPQVLRDHRYRFRDEVDELHAAVLARLARRGPFPGPAPAASPAGPRCAVEVAGARATTADAAPPGAFVAAVLEAPGRPYLLDPALAAAVAGLVGPHCRCFCSPPLTALQAEAVLAWAPSLGTERAVATATAALA